jgi:hypothetical protein
LALGLKLKQTIDIYVCFEVRFILVYVILKK